MDYIEHTHEMSRVNEGTDGLSIIFSVGYLKLRSFCACYSNVYCYYE
jgi:hypothetical protein